MVSGYDLAKSYERGELQGWGETQQPGLAKEAFNMLGDRFADPVITGAGQYTAETRKMFLWDIVRAVLGKDRQNVPQQVGDCVSRGAMNATEVLTCTQIYGIAKAMRDVTASREYIQSARLKFRRVFSPYYYGTGRVYVGKGRLGNSDGSLGSWMAEAVQKYGTLFEDEPGVPRYSGAVARAWGDPRPENDLDKWFPVADQYDVKSATRITSWDQLVQMIVNGYPATVASGYGFRMEPDRDGFHRQVGSWSHQMAIIGIDDEWRSPYGVIENSWGDVHGSLLDFYTNEPLPVGCLRVHRADIEKMIRNGEVFCFANFEGFRERELTRDQFMML